MLFSVDPHCSLLEQCLPLILPFKLRKEHPSLGKMANECTKKMFRSTSKREMLIKIKQVSTKLLTTFKADNTQSCEDVRYMVPCHAWQGVN